VVDGSRVTTVTRDDHSVDYIVLRHTVENMPREEKRPRCSESDLLMAFPLLHPSQKPPEDSQNVYAYLPIRDFGFKVRLAFTCSR